MSVISYNEYTMLTGLMKRVKRKTNVLVEKDGKRIPIGELIQLESTLNSDMPVTSITQLVQPGISYKEKVQSSKAQKIDKVEQPLNQSLSLPVEEVIITPSTTLFIVHLFAALKIKLNNLTVIAKDVWQVLKENMVLVHCISSDMAMSKGFALQVNEKFKNEDEIREAKNYKLEIGNIVGYVNTNQTIKVLYMITKDRKSDKPTEQNFIKCIQKLSTLLSHIKQTTQVDKIIMPAIGTGLDKLDVEFVRESIQANLNHDVIMCIPNVNGEIRTDDAENAIEMKQKNVKLHLPEEIKTSVISEIGTWKCVEQIMSGNDKILIINETCKKCMRSNDYIVKKNQMHTINNLDEDIICGFEFVPRTIRVGLCDLHDKLYESKETITVELNLVQLINGDLKDLARRIYPATKFSKKVIEYDSDKKTAWLKIPENFKEDDFLSSNFIKLFLKTFSGAIPKFKDIHMTTYDHRMLKNVMPKTLPFLLLLTTFHTTESVVLSDDNGMHVDYDSLDMDELNQLVDEANQLVENVTVPTVNVEQLYTEDKKPARSLESDGLKRLVREIVSKKDNEQVIGYELISQRTPTVMEYYSVIKSQLKSFEERFLLTTNKINVKYFYNKIANEVLTLELANDKQGNIQAGAFVECLNEYDGVKRTNLIHKWVMYYWIHINNLLSINKNDMKVKITYYQSTDNIKITAV